MQPRTIAFLNADETPIRVREVAKHSPSIIASLARSGSRSARPGWSARETRPRTRSAMRAAWPAPRATQCMPAAWAPAAPCWSAHVLIPPLHGRVGIFIQCFSGAVGKGVNSQGCRPADHLHEISVAVVDLPVCRSRKSTSEAPGLNSPCQAWWRIAQLFLFVVVHFFTVTPRGLKSSAWLRLRVACLCDTL